MVVGVRQSSTTAEEAGECRSFETDDQRERREDYAAIESNRSNEWSISGPSQSPYFKELSRGAMALDLIFQGYGGWRQAAITAQFWSLELELSGESELIESSHVGIVAMGFWHSRGI